MEKDLVEIEINGKKLLAKRGASVLQVALDAGIPIPHFCYHKKLSVTASCRMCMVESNGSSRPAPSCVMPATEGMVIHTHTHQVTEAQKAVLEFLLINHPLDCPVCDQAGECRLQDLSVGYGRDSSRYQEEKRIVLGKDAGVLVSMREMNRCIHCTRCIRFCEEIAGIQELGMLNRSDRAEIALSMGKMLTSELSGNMIDICPVGALTSKVFRFKARNWELANYHSISPHDSLGSNLIIQTLRHQVMRVLPQENESINECWISDRDRFSYEGLNSKERLSNPMIKQNNQWIETDWATALSYVVHGLKDISADDGADSLAALCSSQATLEEMLILKQLMNGLGSSYIDCRSPRMDFSLDGKIIPWFGMTVADIDTLDSAFIIGSFLRKEQPVMSVRFRRAARKGAVISYLHGMDDDWLMPVKYKMIAPPSQWSALLAEVVVAVAEIKGCDLPDVFKTPAPTDTARGIAMTLLTEGNHAIFLGNVAARHPQMSELHVLAEWLAKNTGAKFGYLTDGANMVGACLVHANKEMVSHAESIFSKQHQAYLLLHTEPELDAVNPFLAKAYLSKAKMVVVMSPYQHGFDYADVMLPISPFTETAGTYINCEGRVQSFYGTVKPLGQARPAWKVLRTLGGLLKLNGFEYSSSEEIREIFINDNGGNITDKLNNFSGLPAHYIPVKEGNLERLSDVSSVDPIIRRATALMEVQKEPANCIYLSLMVCKKLGLTANSAVIVQQGDTSVQLNVIPDKALPDNVARVDCGHKKTAMLGPVFGALHVRPI